MQNVMKRIFILSVLAVVVLVAHATDYNYLIFAQSGGSKTAVEAEGLMITFTDGYLVATTEAGDVTRISLADMSSMWFSESATTGIATIGSSQSVATISGRSIIAQADRGTRYTVATLSGMLISQGTIDGTASQTIAHGLASGLYVVRIGEKSIKLQVR